MPAKMYVAKEFLEHCRTRAAEALELGVIDEQMQNIVLQVNKLHGIASAWCCSGHEDGSSPYLSLAVSSPLAVSTVLKIYGDLVKFGYGFAATLELNTLLHTDKQGVSYWWTKDDLRVECDDPEAVEYVAFAIRARDMKFSNMANYNLTLNDAVMRAVLRQGKDQANQ